ncbi:Uncharacterised protein [Bacillus paranthracis]|nr:Uncharacterised protein [Bacillus paranthracis]
MIWLSCTLFIKGIVINISKIADKKKAKQLIITSIFKPIMPYNIPPNTGATILDNACTPFTIPFACSNFFSGTNCGILAITTGAYIALTIASKNIIVPINRIDTDPVNNKTIKLNTIAVFIKSKITINLRRLKRSAIAPPRGASKNGILVIAYNPANISARPVKSSTYNDSAKRKSVEPKIVIICPLNIK